MLAEVLGQRILTTGAYTERVEALLADYLGVKHALCVTSCTGALHLSLLGLGIGPGDEVITTPMTFIATATAIMEAGAKPVFVDVEPETGNIDPAKIEAAITERTRAIMPVHLYGLMADMQRLRTIADRHRLSIVEDAAHCVEGRRDGIRPGGLGETACFSFYATKNLTCGEGGAIVTNDTALYQRLKLLRVHGMDKTANDRAREGYTHWDMPVFGWKYNMSNIDAALLVPQFARLPATLARRQALAERYVDRLTRLADVDIPAQVAGTPDTCIHAHHLFPIWTERRDAVIAALQHRNVEVVVNYRAIHLLTYLQDTLGHRPGDFPVAEALGRRTLSLPFYPSMPPEDVDAVVGRLEEALAEAR
ncbi:conserved hypothetical protein [Magnetospirillum sp. LM-5]|nr:conserved hypothetical protein [Magnetospirillum sp. LM-5]